LLRAEEGLTACTPPRRHAARRTPRVRLPLLRLYLLFCLFCTCHYLHAVRAVTTCCLLSHAVPAVPYLQHRCAMPPYVYYGLRSVPAGLGYRSFSGTAVDLTCRAS